jgi:uncharacterized protein (TIGR02996 family)
MAMKDKSEERFLRGLLAAPEDTALRQVYADWLEERGDPRAEFVRDNSGFAQIERGLETAPLHDRWRVASASFDPGWVAFMDALGQPFKPFFFGNSASPAFCEKELPFKEPIGVRGAIVTFESAFRSEKAWDSGLLADLGLLRRLWLGDCYYGAASCPVHPFICEMDAHRKVTGAVVLEALKARDFQSEHIRDLNATYIPFPGYHPGTDNDEIHNDFAEQYIFRHPGEEEPGEEDDGEPNPTRSLDAYRALQGFVKDQRLWYVLLHAGPIEVFQGIELYGDVVLFAVGKSPHGNRLLGVVTHQVCHNLCD